ncbi:SIMPL domain-containing protein [bacterium]|nr:SIMPL domain-containing protein [bacterium]
MNTRTTLVLGVCLVAAGAVLGWTLGSGALRVKALDRTVVVKGLAEREIPADVVIWPIAFTAADNDLNALYGTIGGQSAAIEKFLAGAGIPADEITRNAPAIVDKLAQSYGGNEARFRYSATQVVTVYSRDVARVRAAQKGLADLGRQGIVFSGEQYGTQTQYLFTGLNDIKPDMIEEATRNAREVGEKFARDSSSTLGKIRSAQQGQFSITDRDQNNPHIKKVRVVSTVEYYLSD